MIKEIKDALEYLKTVIETSTTAGVKAIAKSVFSVNISNEDPIDVNIKNLPADPDIWKELRELLQQIPEKKVAASELDNLRKSILDVKSSIDKLPREYPKIEFPKSQPISQLPKINFPDYPKFPEEISVKNLQHLVKAIENLMSRSATDPIAVRLSDGDKFYEAITEVITGGMNSYPYSSSTGSRNPALITKKREQIVSVVDRFSSNDIDSPSIDLTYIGQENVDGDWMVKKIVQSGSINSFRYATIKNNEDIETYADAWSDRVSLNYGTVGEVLT
jgi:hypothetical protein